MKQARSRNSFQREPHDLRALEQQTELFVKYEYRCFFSALACGRHKLERKGALSRAGGAQYQGARSLLDAPAKKRIELGNVALDLAPHEARPMFGRH